MTRLAGRLLTRILSPAFRSRLGFKLLRDSSRDFRAYSELFVPPYNSWVDWKSGLGDGAYLLYAVTRSLRPSVVVEIGSARGKSTCALALACRQNGKGKVFAIDPHILNSWTDNGTNAQTLTFLTERIADYGLEHWCAVIQADSQTAARTWATPVDFLFIDGDHTFEGVRRDFEMFEPWLTPHALVAFHDSAWMYHTEHKSYRPDMGVPQYLDQLRRSGYHSVTFPNVPGLTILDPRRGGFPFVNPAVAHDPDACTLASVEELSS